MHDNKMEFLIFSICSGSCSLLFWLILLSENLSTTKFVIALLLALFTMGVSLISAFFTIFDIGCLKDWYDDIVEWNSERKIRKVKF